MIRFLRSSEYPYFNPGMGESISILPELAVKTKILSYEMEAS